MGDLSDTPLISERRLRKLQLLRALIVLATLGLATLSWGEVIPLGTAGLVEATLITEAAPFQGGLVHPGQGTLRYQVIVENHGSSDVMFDLESYLMASRNEGQIQAGERVPGAAFSGQTGIVVRAKSKLEQPCELSLAQAPTAGRIGLHLKFPRAYGKETFRFFSPDIQFFHAVR